MRRDDLQARVAEAFGDPVVLLAAWERPPTPAPTGGVAWHAVVALDPVRMTGLRDWRDAVERFMPAPAAGAPAAGAPAAELEVSAEEIGRWVRRLRRGHGGAWAQACVAPQIDPFPELFRALTSIVAPVPPEVLSWWPRGAPEGLQRLAREGAAMPDVGALDGWLAQARQRVAGAFPGPDAVEWR